MSEPEVRSITRNDPGFYPLLGPYLASRDVARYIGDRIWDDEGKTWHAALDSEGEVAGFIATRSRGKLVLAESCYAAPECQDVVPMLIQASIGAAAPSPMATTVLHEHAGPYLAAGFAEVGRTTRFVKLARSPR